MKRATPGTTHGWQWAITDQDWQGLLSRYDESCPEPALAIREIVESVVLSGVGTDLCFATSMWDLIVATHPADSPPVDAIAVRTAAVTDRVGDGQVLIEHLPLAGPADAITRPSAEAVPLFWRFLSEKYGVVARDRA